MFCREGLVLEWELELELEPGKVYRCRWEGEWRGFYDTMGEILILGSFEKIVCALCVICCEDGCFDVLIAIALLVVYATLCGELMICMRLERVGDGSVMCDACAVCGWVWLDLIVAVIWVEAGLWEDGGHACGLVSHQSSVAGSSP